MKTIMESDDPRPRKRKRPALVALVAAALLLLLAFLLRNCLGLGMGTGTDESQETEKSEPVLTDMSDARAPTPSNDDARSTPAVCVIKLDAEQLTVDGQAASIEDAVRVCGKAGRVSLDVTGGAPTGTYNELVRALDRAGVKGVPPPEEL
jgi:hypothetical protein